MAAKSLLKRCRQIDHETRKRHESKDGTATPGPDPNNRRPGIQFLQREVDNQIRSALVSLSCRSCISWFHKILQAVWHPVQHAVVVWSKRMGSIDVICKPFNSCRNLWSS